MPRLKGPPKAQIRLRVSKSVAAAVTARGQGWFERTLRLALRNGGLKAHPVWIDEAVRLPEGAVSLVVDRQLDNSAQWTTWPPGPRS